MPTGCVGKGYCECGFPVVVGVDEVSWLRRTELVSEVS
jgi:hypothetical protein